MTEVMHIIEAAIIGSSVTTFYFEVETGIPKWWVLALCAFSSCGSGLLILFT